MHRTESGYIKCQRVILMTIIFRDGTSSSLCVAHGSITEFAYRNDGHFIFGAYNPTNDDDDDEGVMFHEGAATYNTHTVERDTIKDVIVHQEHLFHGGHVYYIWRNEEDNNDYVVASEDDVENLV